jgi:hypothetical protein
MSGLGLNNAIYLCNDPYAGVYDEPRQRYDQIGCAGTNIRATFPVRTPFKARCRSSRTTGMPPMYMEVARNTVRLSTLSQRIAICKRIANAGHSFRQGAKECTPSSARTCSSETYSPKLINRKIHCN